MGEQRQPASSRLAIFPTCPYKSPLQCELVAVPAPQSPCLGTCLKPQPPDESDEGDGENSLAVDT